VGLKEQQFTLPYALLEKSRMTYSVVTPTHPLGTCYKDHLSGDKGKGAGFRAKTLFLGACCDLFCFTSTSTDVFAVTKDPIPQEVLENWFHPSTAPAIPGDSLKRGRAGE
jgi:hypothetical protein